MRYRAFDLIWKSTGLELPELPKPEGPAAAGIPGTDVQIVEEDPAGWPVLPQEAAGGSGLVMRPGELQLAVEGVGRFRVSDGNRIGWSRWSPVVADHELRTYLLGSAVGAVLIQRGILVLHGNALARGDRAIVCLGASGAGKSTLAYALMRQGWRLLADDLVAITPEGRVLPGIPRIKLWNDAAAAFGLEAGALPVIHRFDRRGAWKVLVMGDPIQRAEREARLEALYLLDRHLDAEAWVLPFETQQERVMLLREQAYRPQFVRGLGREGDNFLALASLQRRIPFTTLRLPLGITAMEQSLAGADLLSCPVALCEPRRLGS
jgi:hypothetical protein